MTDAKKMLAQIKRHEGLRLEVYRCTAGRLTIGYGHNLEASPIDGLGVGSVISPETAHRILIIDVESVIDRLERQLSWAKKLSPARRAVLINMGYQLGVAGLLGFRRMLYALRRNNYLRASAEMLDSRWAREYSPSRAAELAAQMQTGEWQ